MWLDSNSEEHNDNTVLKHDIDLSLGDEMLCKSTACFFLDKIEPHSTKKYF